MTQRKVTLIFNTCLAIFMVMHTFVSVFSFIRQCIFSSTTSFYINHAHDLLISHILFTSLTSSGDLTFWQHLQ